VGRSAPAHLAHLGLPCSLLQPILQQQAEATTVQIQTTVAQCGGGHSGAPALRGGARVRHAARPQAALAGTVRTGPSHGRQRQRLADGAPVQVVRRHQPHASSAQRPRQPWRHAHRATVHLRVQYRTLARGVCVRRKRLASSQVRLRFISLPRTSRFGARPSHAHDFFSPTRNPQPAVMISTLDRSPVNTQPLP
jgi:hypothetical protein